MPSISCNSLSISNQTFQNNQIILTADLSNIAFANNDMNSAFRNCYNLTTIYNMNTNVTDMTSTFYSCHNLVNIPTIPNSVTTIGDMLADCTNFNKVITIPNSVTYMRGTFEMGNVSYQRTTAPVIPNSVIDLSDTFTRWDHLINAPTIPNSVTEMNRTFLQCFNLTDVPLIPNSVINMVNTFYYCQNLVNTPIIPNSVLNMSECFNGCSHLATPPVIPDGCIDASGFITACKQFFDENLYPSIPSSVQRLDYMYAYMGSNYTDVPQWCLDKWNNCSANVKTSMAGMFYGWSQLVNAPVIPNSVTNISQMFTSCSHLVTAPIIPNNVTDMYFTFSRCSNLITAPIIPNLVINLASCFSYCTNLTGNIYIYSENVNYIGSTSVGGLDDRIFGSTTLQKNVYIPYYYTNNEHTKTYNIFTRAGYGENGTLHGVYLRDINQL